ncbi:MAG: LCP family protein [Armatimonadota bacterium]|nr:LCP family protein [Armatimonadota bacterium]MDR7535401.1 LCP family protein [Armatimonadota bacterium]
MPAPGVPGADHGAHGRPRRPWVRWLLWGTPALIVIVGGLLAGLYLYLVGQVAVREVTVRRPRVPAFAWPLRLVDRVNVLVIGTDITLDNRRRVLNVARADALALVTFDPERGRIGVLSIPRDTRAVIPGHGEAKINASYAYGAAGLTIRTVEQLLGVRIPYYVKLGPDSFARIIDALGGVEVEVERDLKYTDSWAGYTIDLRKGRQRLTGEQATGYIRFRHDALGDIGRVERQHRLLGALLAQLKQPSTLLAAPRLLRAVSAHTDTNLRPAELMALGVFALRVRDHPLQVHTLPGTFAPLYWEPDRARVRALVADLFYGVTLEEVAAVRVEVLNASGTTRLARRVAERLAGLGVTRIRVDRSPRPADVTTIIDRTGRRGLVQMVATALGGAAVRREAPAGEPSMTIVLARDAARVLSATPFRRTD